ncbi:MAG TPA: hypothetical protein PKD54_10110, partial [Pirellulaceae bacterium]|nr:hypothetical protein [Pirellulaceae bacterium]
MFVCVQNSGSKTAIMCPASEMDSEGRLADATLGICQNNHHVTDDSASASLLARWKVYQPACFFAGQSFDNPASKQVVCLDCLQAAQFTCNLIGLLTCLLA